MTIRALTLCALLSTLAFGSEITGKWSGSFEFTAPDGQTRTQPAFVIVRSGDNSYTATGGPSEGQQRPLSKVDFHDGLLRFELGDRTPMQVELRLHGDELAGQGTTAADGKSTVVKWMLTRVR